MKKFKIAFISIKYPTSINPVSGIFVKEHARAVSLYHNVAVITSEFNKELKTLYKVEEYMDDGIRVFRVYYSKSPIPKTTYLIYLWGIFLSFRKLIKEGFIPDIIHAHIYRTGIPALFLGKIYRKPVVLSEHFSSFPRGMIKGIEKLKARFALNRVNLITTVSCDLSNHIKNYGVSSTFKVVPNAVNTEIFHPNIDKKLNDNKRLLLVALFNPIKGIPYLLKAISIVKKIRKDFTLDVVGDGPYRKRYEKYVSELGISDKVKFHGLKTKIEVAQFMRNADIFVLPSIWENLPCVLIEALASGLPIITTSVGGIPEIFNEDFGILIKPEDIEALVDAILYMIEHYKNYSKEKIHSYAKMHFSYESICKQFDEIYNEVLK
jgi:glycosyltransferase involved in cell wall biosynthesis